MKIDNGNIEEINISNIFQVFLEKKRIVVYCTILFFLIGLLAVFVSESLYTSTLKFIPQNENDSSMEGLGSMASLAGINLGSSQNSNMNIPQSMYPTIIQSIPFKLQILEKKLFYSEIRDSISVRDYFNNYYKKPGSFYLKRYSIGLLSTINKSISTDQQIEPKPSTIENGVVYSSYSDSYILNKLEDYISIESGEKNGYVTLSVSMPKSELASQLNQISMEVLQKILIEYKIASAKKEFSFLKSQYLIKKEDFERAQENLASFKDSNQGLISSSLQSRQQKLQYEFDLSFTLFSEIATSLEQARIKISKDTPIFSVIDPVMAPGSKSHPNIPFYLIAYTFLGAFLGMIYVYFLALKRGEI